MRNLASILVVAAVAGCASEAPEPKYPSISEGDIQRIVEHALMEVMDDGSPQSHARNLGVARRQLQDSKNQVANTDAIFLKWQQFEREHPQRWYHALGFGTTDEPGRRMTILALQETLEGALEQACQLPSAQVDRRAYLGDDWSFQQIRVVYQLERKDVGDCIRGQEKSIKSLEDIGN